jgi:hypothetical protein
VVIPTTEREWRGVWIPKEVWLDERLNPLEKVILFEIDSLDKTDSGCFASNEYIAKFCQCSEWKVSNAITKLVSLGYIRIAAFDGRKRTIKSCLGFSLIQPCEFPNSDLGISQDISIRDSNTSNKNKVSISSIDDDFSKFWAAYPRKDGKADALKAWKSLKPNADLQQVILEDIRRRMERGGAWYKTEKRFIKMAGAYLRGRRWEDEGGVTEVAEHREPDPVQLTAEEERIIADIYASGGGWG